MIFNENILHLCGTVKSLRTYGSALISVSSTGLSVPLRVCLSGRYQFVEEIFGCELICLLSFCLCSQTRTSSFWMTPIAPHFLATAAGLVLWSRRCASVLVHATRSLRPPIITSERMEPACCSAVRLVRCRFMPVSKKRRRRRRSSLKQERILDISEKHYAEVVSGDRVASGLQRVSG